MNFVDIVIRATDKTGGQLKRTAGEMKQVSAGAKTTSENLTKLAGSAMAVAAAFKIGWEIGGAVMNLWDKLSGTLDKYTEYLKEAKNQTDNLTNSIKQQAKEVNDLATKSERASNLLSLANKERALQGLGDTGGGAGSREELQKIEEQKQLINEQTELRNKQLAIVEKTLDAEEKKIQSLEKQKELVKGDANNVKNFENLVIEAQKRKKIAEDTIETLKSQNEESSDHLVHLTNQERILGRIAALQDGIVSNIEDSNTTIEGSEKRIKDLQDEYEKLGKIIKLSSAEQSSAFYAPQIGAAPTEAFGAVVGGSGASRALYRREQQQIRDQSKFDRVLELAKSKEDRGIKLSRQEQYAANLDKENAKIKANIDEQERKQTEIAENTKAAADALEKLSTAN